MRLVRRCRATVRLTGGACLQGRDCTRKLSSALSAVDRRIGVPQPSHYIARVGGVPTRASARTPLHTQVQTTCDGTRQRGPRSSVRGCSGAGSCLVPCREPARRCAGACGAVSQCPGRVAQQPLCPNCPNVDTSRRRGCCGCCARSCTPPWYAENRWQSLLLYQCRQ